MLFTLALLGGGLSCARGHQASKGGPSVATLGSVRAQFDPDFLRLTLHFSQGVRFEANPGGELYELTISPVTLGAEPPSALVYRGGGVYQLPIEEGPAESVQLIAPSKRSSELRLRIGGPEVETIRVAVAEDPHRLIIDVIGPGVSEEAQSADALGDLLSAMSGAGAEASAAPEDAPFLVVVDAGHGGFEPGATGPTGVREKDINLAIALALKAQIKARPGMDAILTRETDVFLRLKERAVFANQLGADLFVSIHANGSPSPEPHGIETYYLDTASDAAAARLARFENTVPGGIEEDLEDGSLEAVLKSLSIEGRAEYARSLALSVHGALVKGVKARYPPESVRDLGVKTALFYVLVETAMPGILVESSFVSNPLEEQRLADPAFHRAAAEAIAEGIARFARSARHQDPDGG